MNGPKPTDPGCVEFRLSRRWQWVVLILIAIHALAVFSEPFHFFSRSPVQSAADADWLRNSLRPYSQWMFLDHGYFFFAPNPGPGHLLRAVSSDSPLAAPDSSDDLSLSDGILYPNRNEHRPRLLYHRYFMLSEFYSSRFAPFEVTPELQNDPVLRANWEADRRIYLAMQDSIMDHTKRTTDKPFCRLDRLERVLPDRESVLQQNIRLADPKWLRILPESMLEGGIAPTQGRGNDPVRSQGVQPNSVPATSEELVRPQADRRP
jgi:hypothetical protein